LTSRGRWLRKKLLHIFMESFSSVTFKLHRFLLDMTDVTARGGCRGTAHTFMVGGKYKLTSFRASSGQCGPAVLKGGIQQLVKVRGRQFGEVAQKTC
jgi:hypothetical protein